MAIPKIIHQTIGDKAEVHPIFKANIEKLKRINSNWEHRLYDNEDCRKFISKSYGTKYLNSYDRINPLYGPVKADFFRYLLMYKIGGVYLDIKATAEKKLDDVLQLDDAYILSHWSEKPDSKHKKWGYHPEYGVENEYQQWHIISEPKHPFLKAVISHVKDNIDNYDANRDGVGRKAALKLTGPIAYTLSISACADCYNYRLVDITDLGFKYSVVSTELDEIAHKGIFSNHYSTLNAPIVMPRKKAKFKNKLFNFIFR